MTDQLTIGIVTGGFQLGKIAVTPLTQTAKFLPDINSQRKGAYIGQSTP